MRLWRTERNSQGRGALQTATTSRKMSGPDGTLAQTQPAPKVVIVAPMLARYDAISSAARDTYRMLAGSDALDVRVITLRNDFPDVPADVVRGLAEMLIHPAYLAADVLIYHFGMFNELINALIVGNGHARQIVRFHNITPLQYVAPAHAPLIEDSFRQISNLLAADEVWADSVVNREELERRGIDPQYIHVIPLVVDTPAETALSAKANEPIQLLFLGRIVASKGVLDLVQAIDHMRGSVHTPVHLRLVGNLEWSDREYLERVKRYVRDHHLDQIVEFCGTVTDAERERLYHAAHILAIPSYHEGFCMPVVEALRSGCIPVGYAAYNLPYITNGLGRLVSPGDWRGLGAAVGELVEALGVARSRQDEPLLRLDRGVASIHEFEAAAREYVQEFTHERVAALTRSRVQHVLAHAQRM